MTCISSADLGNRISHETQAFNATTLACFLVRTSLVHSGHGLHRTARQYLIEALNALDRSLHAQERDRQRPTDPPAQDHGSFPGGAARG